MYIYISLRTSPGHDTRVGAAAKGEKRAFSERKARNVGTDKRNGFNTASSFASGE